MIKLIRLEWMKFRKNSVVQMLLWIFIIFFPTLIFVGKEESLTANNPLLKPGVFFNFPTVWDWLGYDGNWMVFFALGFLVVYTISIEISYKTMRQNIITGLTRTEFFLSKLYIVLIFVLIATVLYAITGFTIGWFHSTDPSFAEAMDNDWAIPRFALMSLTYLLFAMFIGFAIRNSGLAVLTYLSYGILLEPMIRWLGHAQIVEEGISKNLYPMNAAEDLMPMPFYQITQNMPNSDGALLLLSYKEAAITSGVYCLIFLGLTYYIFLKRDM